MELIYINKDNIKIHLLSEELEREGLCAEKLNYSTTKAKKFLWNLFDRVHEQSGFDAAEGRLFIRVFPSQNGDCELFVTRIAKLSADAIRIERAEDVSNFVVKVEGYERLYSLCRRLNSEGMRCKSELFSDNEGNYYMTCIRKSPSYRAGARGDFGFVCEYGEKKEYSDELYAYLAEHFELICKDKAIEKILK